MKKILYLVILPSILLVNCQFNKIMPDETLLSEKRITKEISGGQTDTFYIKCDYSSFIFASLFQIGIDVIVKVIDPFNNIVLETDNLKSGPEFISFTTNLAGIYKILVRPFNPMAKTGNYNIGLEKNIKTGNTNNELADQLFAEFDNDYRAGEAVAIVENGKVIYKNGFGVSNFEDKKPITPSAKLNICSIGKQFTAFAVALLEQAGKLSLDDDIHKYLPEIHNFSDKITIHHLLNHSSGLREIADLLELSGNGPSSKADVMKLIYRQEELNFKPGSEYLYCNTGYILLAEIIERITNKPFTEWIKENIFIPLGMNNTRFYYDKENFINDFAWSYSLGNNGNYKKEQLYKAWYVGAGNVFSTVEDMSKWLINFDYPKVGNAKLISRLERYKISMNKDITEFYAFGRVSGNYKGLIFFWHGGGGYGYTAQIAHFPDHKFGVIILSNFIYGGVYGRARQLADIYLKDHFTVNSPVYFDYKNPYTPVKVHNKIISDIEGRYIDDSGVITKITNEKNGLFIQTSGYDKNDLYALSDSVFFIKEADIRFYFIKDKSGKVIRMKSYNGSEESISKKIDNVPEVSKNFKIYVGKYYSEELDTYYTIFQYGNSLVAKHNVNDAIMLTHIKDNLFKGNQWYFSFVEFTKSITNEIIEFKITNDRVRNIRFKKVLD